MHTFLPFLRLLFLLASVPQVLVDEILPNCSYLTLIVLRPESPRLLSKCSTHTFDTHFRRPPGLKDPNLIISHAVILVTLHQSIIIELNSGESQTFFTKIRHFVRRCCGRWPQMQVSRWQ